MELPNVKHINKNKRKKRKHHYKEFDPVVIKWYGERHICFVEQLQFSKEKYPTYRVRSVTSPGCIYYNLELDDPEDKYCYVSSTLTKSLTDAELQRIRTQSDKFRGKGKPVHSGKKKKPQPNITTRLRNDEKKQLEKDIKKQKAFINGKKFW